MVKRTLTPLPKTVKETVDFIYEFLIVHQDGVQFSANSLGGSTQKRILAILVKRGIVERTWLLTGGTGRVCKYKWIATMQPTKTLYGSIVTEIREEQKAWPSHKKVAKSKKSVKEQPAVVDNPQQIEAQKTPEVKADEDKPTWTGWFLLEYKRSPGQFHFSKIMSSAKHDFFIYNGIGTYGWMPIAVVQPKADNARLSLFLSEIEEKNKPTEEIQSLFRKNIKPENIFGDNDDLAKVIARIDPDKDIFIEPQEQPTSVFTGFEPLDGFSDQELWDELKKRGYSIEDNRLVIVKKTYLD